MPHLKISQIVPVLLAAAGLPAPDHPFGATAAAPEKPAPLVLAAGGARIGGWQNVGGPYYFENCWWQRQVFYDKSGRARELNRKLSCPGLSYGAGAIERPSPFAKR